MLTQRKFKKPGVLIWPLVFLLLIFFDQTFKCLAPNVFRNYQFAFSLPVPFLIMYVIYTLAFGGIVYYVAIRRNLFSAVEKLAWVLILTGAALNIGERIALGYVRDFVYITFFRWTGIYNLADGYIIAGMVLLLFGPLIFNDKNNKN